MNKIPKVIAGQSFKVNILLSYFGTADKLDLTTCSDLEVKFICPKHNEEIDMPFEISDGKLKITVDKDTLHVGTYGLEITGEDNLGNYFRFKLKPYEFLMCVDATSEISNNSDWINILDIDINGRIGFDAPWQEGNLLDIIDKKVDKVTGKSLISDTEITRLSEVHNYDDTNILSYIDKKQDNLVSGNNIKTINGNSILGNGDIELQTNIDMSSYVTKEDVNKMGYITAIPSNYITQEQLSSNSYLKSYTVPSNYITQEQLTTNGYITAIPSNYITQEQLSANSYLKSYTVPSNYITQEQLTTNGYITAIPSEYITQTKLSSNGYITAIPSNYITQEQLSSNSYLKSYTVPSNYITQEQLTTNGYITAIPSNYITQEQLSSNSYLKSYTVPSNYITQEQLTSNGYLTAIPNIYATISYVNEQDIILNSSINNKVDKVAGKSLISDDEITRLSEVHNYDDTKLKSYIDSETSYRMKTDILIVKDLSDEITRAKQAESNINSNIPVNISQLTNDSKYQTETEVDNRIKAVVGAAPEALDTLEEIAKQMTTDESAASSITTNLSNLTTRVTTNESNIANKVDKSEGKSLILDSEITRLSEVHNYDDTLLLSKINQKQDTLVSGSNISTINGKSILEGGNIEVATDLSSYVKSSELSNMSYVTQEQLSANSYLKSYTVPSNYVTQEQLSKNGYINGIPSNYITQEKLTSNGYLTAIPSNYITQDQLSSNSYLKSYTVPSNYITQEKLTLNGYLTAIPSNYITQDQLSSNSYLKSYTVPSNYITQEKLTSNGYITSIPSNYITQEQLSANSYLKSYTVPSNYITQEQLSSNSYLKSYTVPSNYITQEKLTTNGYLTANSTASNSDKVDGYHISKVTELPTTTDENTIYILV